MNKLILTLGTLLITLSTFSQTAKNHISVQGTHSYKIEAKYSSKMIVSLTNVYNTETMTFEEIKSGYLNKLEKAGINKEKLNFDAINYALLGYQKKGTIAVYKANSLEEIQKFLSIKSIGVTANETALTAELTDDQMANFSKAAFDDAKRKASATADKIGRKIGEAIYIIDTNRKKISESVYYGNTKETRDYDITVSFELL